MLNMTRTMALTSALALLAAAPAGAAKKTTHKYTSTVTSAPLSTANGYPQPGGTALLTGVLQTKPLGDGAIIDRVTITGSPKPNVFTYKATEVDFLADGTLRNTLRGTDTVQPDGSQKIVAHGRLTGGTARYKGARGTYTFTGSIPAGSTVLHGGSAGSIRY